MPIKRQYTLIARCNTAARAKTHWPKQKIRSHSIINGWTADSPKPNYDYSAAP